MRPIPNISLRLAVTVLTGVAALAVVAVLVLSVVGASALEGAGMAPLVASGAALAALVLAVLRLTRHSVSRTNLDRELRKLLEEEAGKTR
jgi:hypothetical protein